MNHSLTYTHMIYTQINTVPMKYQVGYLDVVGEYRAVRDCNKSNLNYWLLLKSF